ncbi:Neuroligin-3 (Fragment) [Lemmus lemmus]
MARPGAPSGQPSHPPTAMRMPLGPGMGIRMQGHSWSRTLETTLLN